MGRFLLQGSLWLSVAAPELLWLPLLALAPAVELQQLWGCVVSETPTSCHSFLIFSGFRLKCDDKLKILPWAVCRASGLLRCQHLPGRAQIPPCWGWQRGEAPAGTEVPPISQPPHGSLLRLKPLGVPPSPPATGTLGAMAAVPLLGLGAGLACSEGM